MVVLKDLSQTIKGTLHSPDIPDPFFDFQVDLSHWGCLWSSSALPGKF